MLATRTLVGLALTDRSIAVAEVTLRGQRPRLLRSAVLPLSAATDGQTSAPRPDDLRTFLRANHITASRCVLGLDTGWLVAAHKVVPACEDDALAGVMSIFAEQQFASAAHEYAVDFVPPAKADGETAVLLVAAGRERVEQAQALAKAAGLTVTGIGVSALALADLAGPADGVTLALHADRSELVVRAGGVVRALRRLGRLAPDNPQALAGEVRRVVSLVPQAQAGELRVWNEADLPPAALTALTERLAMPLRLCRAAADAGLAADSPAPQPGSAEAVALACQGLARKAGAVDFLHSRLAVPEAGRFSRRVVWSMVAAVLVLAGGVALWVDSRATAREAQGLRSRLETMQEPAVRARQTVETVSFARQWYDQRPAILDHMLRITEAFPPDQRVWATKLSLREDGRAELEVKAQTEAAALSVLDALEADPAFTDVQPRQIRQVGTGTREVSFDMSFQTVVEP